MSFNPLAVTGYLDVSDVPDFFEKTGRSFLASFRQALEGRKRNRYHHLVLQYEVRSSFNDWDEKVLVEVNSAMAKLKEDGYTIDDERYHVSEKHNDRDVYRWTIFWSEE